MASQTLPGGLQDLYLEVLRTLETSMYCIWRSSGPWRPPGTLYLEVLRTQGTSKTLYLEVLRTLYTGGLPGRGWYPVY